VLPRKINSFAPETADWESDKVLLDAIEGAS
jgi:hypothetical protein